MQGHDIKISIKRMIATRLLLFDNTLLFKADQRVNTFQFLSLLEEKNLYQHDDGLFIFTRHLAPLLLPPGYSLHSPCHQEETRENKKLTHATQIIYFLGHAIRVQFLLYHCPRCRQLQDFIFFNNLMGFCKPIPQLDSYYLLTEIPEKQSLRALFFEEWIKNSINE